MAKPKEHKAKIVQRRVMGEKANESPQIYAQVGDGGGVVATGRANFYHIRLRGDDNRVTQCYSLVPLADGDLIYVRQSQDRKLRYYEFVEFIQAAGGGTGPPVPYHNVLGPYHGDAATAAIAQGDVLVGDATPEINRLPIGTPDQLLTVNAAGTDPVWASNLRQILEFELNDATILTIDVNGTITRTQAYHAVAANAGVADDLVQIDGGVQGDMLVIRPDAGDTITVHHNEGGAGDNIWLAGGADIVLDNDDHLALIFDGTWWCDQSGGAGLVVHNHSGPAAGGDDLRPETISSQGYVVGAGCPHTTLASAVAAVNAAGPPALGTEYVIRIIAGTTTEAGNITIPAYCTVQGAGENSIVDMQANTLTLSGNSSLKDLVVLSSNATAAIDMNNAADVVVRNVRCVESGGGYCFWMRGSTTACLYHCTAQATAVNARGFQISDTGVALLWDCDACDSTNFDYGLNLNNVAGTAATALFCRFQAATDDVLVSANAALTHFDCQFDPNNSTFAGGAHTALPTKRFNQWLIVAEQGGDFDLLSEAVAWVNAQGDAATGKRYGIKVAAGNFAEAGNVTVPSWVAVEGCGESSIIEMGDNILYMSDDSSLLDLVVRGSHDPWIVEINNADCRLRNVRVTHTAGGIVDCIYIHGDSTVYLDNVSINADVLSVLGVNITDTATVFLRRCDIFGNLVGAITLDNTACTAYTIYCYLEGAGALDVVVGAAATWYDMASHYDASKLTLDGTFIPLPQSPVNLDGRADALILDANGDTTISAPTDDKVDFEVGGSDIGFLIAGGWEGSTFAFIVKNTSGGAVSANAVGYIDSAGEFKTTTTAYLDVEWCVVLTGGANNADIYVARRGRVTVTLNGNCAAGDYLYTSTTAGQAQPQSYVRPELFAVALTANAGGAGGTCSALLLCHSRFVPMTSSKYLIYINLCDASDFRATISGVAAAIVSYNVPISGSDNTIDPQAANYLGKIRLYNEVDGDYALIDDVNTGARQITLTANAPAGWAIGETITTRSQTTVEVGSPYWYDIDLTDSDNDAVPILARTLQFQYQWRDSAVAGRGAYLHPHEALASSKVMQIQNPAINVGTFNMLIVPLFQRRFEIRWNSSGAGTGFVRLQLMGYYEAAP